MYIDKGTFDVRIPMFEKKNHSMKTVMSYQEFSLSGRTYVFYLQYYPYLIHRRHLLWSQSFIKVQNSSIFQRM